MNAITQLKQDEIKLLQNTFERYIASKTSNALATMFSEPIKYSVRILEHGISDLKKLNIQNDEINMCGIRLNGKGDTHIEICYTMKIKHAKKIASKLLCQDQLNEIDDLGMSALQEVANIMTGSFFNAMAHSTGFRVDLSTPDFAQGQLMPIVSVVAQDVSNNLEGTIVADAEFESQKSGFKIHMLIMQDSQNARNLLCKDTEHLREHSKASQTTSLPNSKSSKTSSSGDSVQ